MTIREGKALKFIAVATDYENGIQEGDTTPVNLEGVVPAINPTVANNFVYQSPVGDGSLVDAGFSAGTTGQAVIESETEAEARDAILAPSLRPEQVDIVGTTHTFVLTNEDQIVVSQSASPTTFTIPLNSAAAFPIGAIVGTEQHGAGALTVEATVGVTLNGVSGGSETITVQWGAAALRKTGTDSWVIIGAI